MSRNPIAEKAVVEPPGFSVIIPSLVVTALISLSIGYWLGKGDSLPYFSKSRARHPKIDGANGRDVTPAFETNAVHDEYKLVSPS